MISLSSAPETGCILPSESLICTMVLPSPERETRFSVLSANVTSISSPGGFEGVSGCAGLFFDGDRSLQISLSPEYHSSRNEPKAKSIRAKLGGRRPNYQQDDGQASAGRAEPRRQSQQWDSHNICFDSSPNTLALVLEKWTVFLGRLLAQ